MKFEFNEEKKILKVLFGVIILSCFIVPILRLIDGEKFNTEIKILLFCFIVSVPGAVISLIQYSTKLIVHNSKIIFYRNKKVCEIETIDINKIYYKVKRIWEKNFYYIKLYCNKWILVFMIKEGNEFIDYIQKRKIDVVEVKSIRQIRLTKQERKNKKTVEKNK